MNKELTLADAIKEIEQSGKRPYNVSEDDDVILVLGAIAILSRVKAPDPMSEALRATSCRC